MSATPDGLAVGALLAQNALVFPDRTAYRMGGDSVSHRELEGLARRLVSAMFDNGVRRGDRVALIGRNSIAFAIVLAATQLSGITLVPISFRLSNDEVRGALRRVHPAMVFGDDNFVPLLREERSQLPGLIEVVSLDDATGGVRSLDAVIAGGVERELAVPAAPDDVACLMFTSGTTGAAKCCIVGHREFRDIALTMNAAMRSGSDDRVLINMPMFHIGAMAIAAGIHARGGTVILQQQFDHAQALRLIGEEQITVLHLAPVMLRALLDARSGSEDLTTIRTVVYSAAPMTPSLLRRALDVLPLARFHNLYGQTEAIVSGLPPEMHVLGANGGADRLGSVGIPFPGVQVKIVDPSGLPLPDGEPGEILVKSDNMFRGYWNDPAATAAAVRDGWYHTGDIGRLDDRGLLYLVDRAKDVIITGGENVYSPEVEDVIGQIDGVSECAVIGVPDQQWGEAVCAVLVVGPGMTVTLEEVQMAVRRRLAGFKAPRRLVCVAELPVLASGKVDKKRLRAQVNAHGGVPG